MLCTNRCLTADHKLMPMVFVVNNRPYWFLNAARRAAFKTKYPIEIIGIEAAYEWNTGHSRKELNKHDVNWHFDQKGETFNGQLFEDLIGVMADSVNIKIISEG